MVLILTENDPFNYKDMLFTKVFPPKKYLCKNIVPNI